MIIRSIRTHEREIIARIHRTSAEHAYQGIFPVHEPFPWDETLTRWIQFVGPIILAEDSDTHEVVGFLAFDACELDAIYVLPDYWDRGVGGRLLEAAGPVSHLWVLEGNLRARRFYEKRGWKSDGTSRQHGGVTELRYERMMCRNHGGPQR